MNPFLRNIQAIESPYSGLPSVIPNFSSAPKVFGMDIGNMSGTSPNTTFDPRSGTMIGADAPEGFGRYWGGFLDIFTGGDADKRGHGGGKKAAEGYGGVAENYETNTKGEITKIPPKKDKYDGMYTPKEYKDINKDYLETVGTESAKLAQHNFLLAQMNKLPDRMSLGNMMKADAYKNQGDRSVTSNIGLMNNMGLPGGLAQFSYNFQRFG